MHGRYKGSGLASSGLNGKGFDFLVDDRTHTISFASAICEATICPCTQVIKVKDRDTAKCSNFWLNVAGQAYVDNVERVGIGTRTGASDQAGGDHRVSCTGARYNHIADRNDVGQPFESNRLAVDSLRQSGTAFG
jgi:hypothetical protein